MDILTWCIDGELNRKVIVCPESDPRRGGGWESFRRAQPQKIEKWLFQFPTALAACKMSRCGVNSTSFPSRIPYVSIHPSSMRPRRDTILAAARDWWWWGEWMDQGMTFTSHGLSFSKATLRAILDFNVSILLFISFCLVSHGFASTRPYMIRTLKYWPISLLAFHPVAYIVREQCPSQRTTPTTTKVSFTSQPFEMGPNFLSCELQPNHHSHL